MKSPTLRSESHLAELDGLRGVAILLVFVFHCLPNTGIEVIDRIGLVRFSFWIGVDLFFVLSGFLITGILIDHRGASNRWKTFYGRRVLRIFPLFYFALSAVFLAGLFFQPLADQLSRTASAPWLFSYLFNFWLSSSGGWPGSEVVNHFWSLCVEEQFYLFWPFLVFYVRRDRLPWVMGFTVVFAWLFKWWIVVGDTPLIAAHVLMPARMDAFALGGLVAWMLRHPDHCLQPKVVRRIVWLAAIAIAAIALPARGLFPDQPMTPALATPLLAVLFAGTIFLAVRPVGEFGRLAALWRTAPLRLAGRYSYGLYVYHWLVQSSVVKYDLFGIKTDHPWLNFAVVCFLSFGFTVASYHLLEMPFLRLKRLFRFHQKPVGASATDPAAADAAPVDKP